MNKCPFGPKRFHALKKVFRIFLLTIFQVSGKDLPEAREVFDDICRLLRSRMRHAEPPRDALATLDAPHMIAFRKA